MAIDSPQTDAEGKQQTKEYVYQDGVYRSNPRDSPSWSRQIVIGVLVCILILIVLFVIGFFFFIQSAVKKELDSNDKSQPLPCLPKPKHEGYDLLFEDSLISRDYKYYFYAGKFPFVKAQEVCRNLTEKGDLITVQSVAQETGFDNRIRGLANKLFVNEGSLNYGFRKQIWTGGYIDLEQNGILRVRWLDETALQEWTQSFCDREHTIKAITALRDEYRNIRRKNGTVPSPLIYIVKDYRQRPMITKKFTSGEPGCWQIYSSFLHEMDHLEFNFACQVSTARLPFKFVRKFLGKFRPNGQPYSWILEANEYAAFSGRGSFTVAQETCQRFTSGAQMLASKTLARDHEINKRVEHHSAEIFGEDNGDPNRRTLIWTGGYFNLSSAYPTKVRWADDPNAALDIEEPPKRKYFGSSDDKPFVYENFCGTIEYYNSLIEDALKEERDAAKTSGCIKGRLFLIVKDYRDGQSVQGCWHVYDYDYLSRHEYTLFLICQLPNPVRSNYENFKESEQVFSYQPNSKDP